MTLEQALIDAMRERGFETVTVKFIRTDRHTLRWTRSLTTIDFKVPKDIEALPDEASRELAESIALGINTGVKREWSPSTVLAIRETTGWPLPNFDAEGNRIPGPVEAVE